MAFGKLPYPLNISFHISRMIHNHVRKFVHINTQHVQAIMVLTLNLGEMWKPKVRTGPYPGGQANLTRADFQGDLWTLGSDQYRWGASSRTERAWMCEEQGFKGRGPLGYHGAILILSFLGFRIRIVSFVVNSKMKPGGEHRRAGGLGGCCCGLDSPTLHCSLTEPPCNC